MNKVVSETLQSTFLYGHPGDKLQWFTSDCSLESITSVNLFLPGEAAATGCNFQTPYPGDGFASGHPLCLGDWQHFSCLSVQRLD